MWDKEGTSVDLSQWRRHGRTSYYLTEKDRRHSVTLTSLATTILDAAAVRTRRSRSDVVEYLLRDFGSKVEFHETT
jgi:hypothetical protein